jgi:hypothetical protein
METTLKAARLALQAAGLVNACGEIIGVEDDAPDNALFAAIEQHRAAWTEYHLCCTTLARGGLDKASRDSIHRLKHDRYAAAWKALDAATFTRATTYEGARAKALLVLGTGRKEELGIVTRLDTLAASAIRDALEWGPPSQPLPSLADVGAMADTDGFHQDAPLCALIDRCGDLMDAFDKADSLRTPDDRHRGLIPAAVRDLFTAINAANLELAAMAPRSRIGMAHKLAYVLSCETRRRAGTLAAIHVSAIRDLLAMEAGR